MGLPEGTRGSKGQDYHLYSADTGAAGQSQGANADLFQYPWSVPSGFPSKHSGSFYRVGLHWTITQSCPNISPEERSWGQKIYMLGLNGGLSGEPLVSGTFCHRQGHKRASVHSAQILRVQTLCSSDPCPVLPVLGLHCSAFTHDLQVAPASPHHVAAWGGLLSCPMPRPV